MNDLSLIGAIVGPVASIGGAVITFVYRMGKKVGKLENCPEQINELNKQIGEVSIKVARIEGKLGINPEGEENE